MNTSADRKTMAWIKVEIENTLEKVHDAPDNFIENIEDTSPIANCIEPLQLTKGALEMVHVSGGTMLATELLHLAQALVDNKVKRKMEAAEVLAIGMLQLPGYVDSLYHGQPDMPLILLPLLNDLLAVQEKELLTEGEFFSPDLSVVAPLIKATDNLVSGEINTVARKLRPGYLSSLLGVLQGKNVNENLDLLSVILENLLCECDDEKARQLWWITTGVIDSLRDQGLEISITIKILLGRIDQQIKRLIDTDESDFTNNPPDKIIKNLLYYVSQVKTYNHRATEIKKAFTLDFPDDDAINDARKSLYGFNINLVDSIYEQVNHELATIKEALNFSMHAKDGSSAGLEPVIKHFRSISDALGMLGMTKLQNVMTEYREFITPKISRGEALEDDDLMGIASALLHVESSLTDFAASINPSKNAGNLPPAEYEKILKITSQEIITEIKTVKSFILQYSNDTSELSLIENASTHLLFITGAMTILRHDTQASLSKSIYDYVHVEIIEKLNAVNNANLDYLANAIVALEYYYESILEKSVAPEVGLKVAYQSMIKLGYQPEMTDWEIANGATNSLLDQAS